MTHADLVTYCLAAHVGLIALLVAPFYKWVFYDEVLRKRLLPINKTIHAVAKTVGDDLAVDLRIVLEKSSVQGDLEVNDDSAVYVERLAKVWTSEAFRESIQDFVGKRVASFVDLKSVVSLKRQIRAWTIVRSVLLLVFLVAEVVLIVRLGIDKFGKGPLTDAEVPLLFLWSGLFLFLLLVAITVLMIKGGRAGYFEDKYEIE